MRRQKQTCSATDSVRLKLPVCATYHGLWYIAISPTQKGYITQKNQLRTHYALGHVGKGNKIKNTQAIIDLGVFEWLHNQNFARTR